MLHKAFVFDWAGFERELLPSLTASLRADDPGRLLRFIDAHRDRVKDPYEGDPIPDDWQEVFDVRDVQNIGDFALTCYYEPTSDSGLDVDWMRIADERPDIAYSLLLGTPVGPRKNRFDPGCYGSYFRRPEELSATLAALAEVREPALKPFRAVLRSATRRGLGLYVTF